MKKKRSSIEKTFLMVKPDGVARGLVGRVFQRVEEMGMKLIAARMIKAKKEQVSEHYPGTDEDWLKGIGEKATSNFGDDLEAVKKAFGTTKKLEIGKTVYNNLEKYICESPVIISVWEGNHAVERVRRVAGHAVPTESELGSLRSNFAFDSPVFATKTGRIVFKNIVHISDSVSEAKREMKIWFGDKFKDLSDYERIDYVDML